MSALPRELEEARKRAGDAEAEAYALRAEVARMSAMPVVALPEALRVQHALAAERDEARAALDVTSATLREHARALREARAVIASQEVALAQAAAESADARAELAAESDGRMALRRRFGAHDDETFGGFVARLAGCDDGAAVTHTAAPMPEQQQLPETPATEAPHAVGDVWRNAHGEGVVTGVVEAGREGGWFECRIALDYGHLSRVGEWHDSGWRRIRCAPEAAAAPAAHGPSGCTAPLMPWIVVDAKGDCTWCYGERCSKCACTWMDTAPHEATPSEIARAVQAAVLASDERKAAAPAVGDPVRVRLDGRAVEGRIGREPEAGSAQAFRVEAADGREAYGRAADLELLAGEK